MRWDNIDYYDLASQLGIAGRVSVSGHLYAPCPLHKDRSPSFSLNIESGLWYCHAEARGGSFAQLVQEVRGVPYAAAVRWVLRHANLVALDDPAAPDVPDPLHWEVERYGALSTQSLPTYWFWRGYDWATADRWGVRYDPVARQLVIPYRYPFNGPIMGFIRRTVVAGEYPKYRNTPGLRRTSMLFGYGARPLHGQPLLLVEGPLDAIRADSYGYPAVALLGLQLSDYQRRLLAHAINSTVVVALDSGPQGREAAYAIAQRLEDVRIHTRLFRYPEGSAEHDLDIDALTRRDVIAGVEGSTDPLMLLIP